MKHKKNNEPKLETDIKVGMKFKDTNPRTNGTRYIKVVEIILGVALCESWYSGKNKRKMTSRILLTRLLKFGHRGYKYIGMC